MRGIRQSTALSCALIFSAFLAARASAQCGMGRAGGSRSSMNQLRFRPPTGTQSRLVPLTQGQQPQLQAILQRQLLGQQLVANQLIARNNAIQQERLQRLQLQAARRSDSTLRKALAHSDPLIRWVASREIAKRQNQGP